MLVGVAVGCAQAGFVEGVVLAGLAATFASSVTYTRAKAESLGVHGEVGIAPRPERVLLLAGGLVLGGLLGGVGPIPTPAGFAPIDGQPYLGGTLALTLAIVLIAASSAITVVQRIVHVRKQLDQQEKP